MNVEKMRLGATLAALLFCGCSQNTNRCTNFPAEYKRIDLKHSSREELSLRLPEIKKALLIIQECYPSHKYMGFDNELRIQSAFRLRSDLYMIVADLHGVSDLILMFEIDRSGRVRGSYQASTL